MKNAIILGSGGLDSVVCGYYTKLKMHYDNLIFLFFDYGQRTLKQEEECLKFHAKKLGWKIIKVDITWLGEISGSFINNDGSEFPVTTDEIMKDKEKEKSMILNWIVPCRNTVFLSVALAHAEAYDLKGRGKFDIFVGFDGGSVRYKDTTPKFIGFFNKLINECTENGDYKVISPLIKKDKDEIIKIGQELGVDFTKTYSCYIGGEGLVHCGKCSNCMYRKQAFYWAGLEDPSTYK